MSQKALCYKGTKFHRISEFVSAHLYITLTCSVMMLWRVLTDCVSSLTLTTVPNFMIQGGDISDSNGAGGESIYGGYYDDEQSEVRMSRLRSN